jgi:hypothetical protein
VWLRQQYVNEFVYLETLRKFNALTCRRGRERQFVMERQKLMPILRDEINEQLLVEMVCEKVQDNIIRSRLFERRDTKLVDVFTYLLSMATSNEMMDQQRERGTTQTLWNRPQRPDVQSRNQSARQPAHNNLFCRNIPPVTKPQRRRRLECYICSSLSHLQARYSYQPTGLTIVTASRRTSTVVVTVNCFRTNITIRLGKIALLAVKIKAICNNYGRLGCNDTGAVLPNRLNVTWHTTS